MNQSPEFEFVFKAYGVTIGVVASSKELLDEAEEVVRRALLGKIEVVGDTTAEHAFEISSDADDVLHLTRNGEHVSYDSVSARFFRFFDSLLRITVAEYATDLVFVHAGVVGWKGKAIVVPASSFRGKTSLVVELVRAGAEYYSDEYAIIDETGLVHAFPRDFSVRYEDGGVKERRVEPEELGARIGIVPIPIGLVLITEFTEGASWDPEILTGGMGLLATLPHAIPRLFKPEFTLKVLNTAVRDAIILKTPRGDAPVFAKELLTFFDKTLNLAKIT